MPQQHLQSLSTPFNSVRELLRVRSQLNISTLTVAASGDLNPAQHDTAKTLEVGLNLRTFRPSVQPVTLPRPT